MSHALAGPDSSWFGGEQLAWARTVDRGGWTVQRLKGCSLQSDILNPRSFPACELSLFDLLASYLSSLILFPNHEERAIMPTSHSCTIKAINIHKANGYTAQHTYLLILTEGTRSFARLMVTGQLPSSIVRALYGREEAAPKHPRMGVTWRLPASA